ncbi:hypothetical protein BpHYR1_040503 [Brachionus plicatilis]|uniref:Uncharacterized protein n=1 Tax=Brachionus plicatilis TaxID=10195 RepID=A0A3M7QFY3_BRAPC|nr:hypothetical protein BpHYR1_040503 [Brachionus plicatilis]
MLDLGFTLRVVNTSLRALARYRKQINKCDEIQSKDFIGYIGHIFLDRYRGLIDSIKLGTNK